MRIELDKLQFQAYPTNWGKNILNNWIGCARFIYNIKSSDSIISLTNKIQIDKSYIQYKDGRNWLNNCPSIILRNSILQFYNNYQKYMLYQSTVLNLHKKKRGEDNNTIWLTPEIFRFYNNRLFIGTAQNNIGFLSYDLSRLSLFENYDDAKKLYIKGYLDNSKFNNFRIYNREIKFNLIKSIYLSRKNGLYYLRFSYENGFDFNNKLIDQEPDIKDRFCVMCNRNTNLLAGRYIEKQEYNKANNKFQGSGQYYWLYLCEICQSYKG